MTTLSRHTLQTLQAQRVVLPQEALFQLPEKVLQFGTGVLLRGLPDYFIDKANRKGVFNGRIVVVKSTDSGDATAFDEQDGLYTLCIRGMEAGKDVEENLVCSAISRVLSAKQQWDAVLQCAQDAAITVIISNTTEVGIQLVNESIFQNPPASFPAKLLAVLYARFKKLGTQTASEIVVLPTELITDNGKKLQAIVMELAQFNHLEAAFFNWLEASVHFCNTLVDCIVPGKPDAALHQQLQTDFGYNDALLIISEVYRLWAIEGDDRIKEILSFAATDNRIIITPDITKYKELKLRLLNGTHTLSCGLAHLAGIRTVKEAMASEPFAAFVSRLMLNEIAPAVPFAIAPNEAHAFGVQVLDRFRNPYLQHQWISITMQYTSKMAMRIVPVLLQHYKIHTTVPEHMALGFAAYLLFMKAVKQEGAVYFGQSNGGFYPINDNQAGYYFDLWRQHAATEVVRAALRNETLWNTDLSQLPVFEQAVNQHLQLLTESDALQAVVLLQQDGSGAPLRT
jgi:tagaturonate reductase